MFRSKSMPPNKHLSAVRGAKLAGRHGRLAGSHSVMRGVLTHAREPFDNQGLHERRLLVYQRVAGAIQYSKGSARVVLGQLPRVCVPGGGVLSPGKNQHGMRIGFRSLRTIA